MRGAGASGRGRPGPAEFPMEQRPGRRRTRPQGPAARLRHVLATAGDQNGRRRGRQERRPGTWALRGREQTRASPLRRGAGRVARGIVRSLERSPRPLRERSERGEERGTRRVDRRGRHGRRGPRGLGAQTAVGAEGSAWGPGRGARGRPWMWGGKPKERCRRQRQRFGSRSEQTGIVEVRRRGWRLGSPPDVTTEVPSGQPNLHPGSPARRRTRRPCLGAACVGTVRPPRGGARLPGGGRGRGRTRHETHWTVRRPREQEGWGRRERSLRTRGPRTCVAPGPGAPVGT